MRLFAAYPPLGWRRRERDGEVGGVLLCVH